MERWTGKAALDKHITELLVWRELIADTMRGLRALGREKEHREIVELLCGIPGIGIVTAMAFLTEVIDIRRFRHADRFASYIGMVPGENSSGDIQQHTGITRLARKLSNRIFYVLKHRRSYEVCRVK